MNWRAGEKALCICAVGCDGLPLIQLSAGAEYTVAALHECPGISTLIMELEGIECEPGAILLCMSPGCEHRTRHYGFWSWRFIKPPQVRYNVPAAILQARTLALAA